MLFLVFFAFVANLAVFWCSLSVSKANPNDFLFEDGKLTADCYNREPSECIFKLETYKSVNNLYLTGFVFDEENLEMFSRTICKMKLLELTLCGCDINNELISLWFSHQV